MAKTSSMYIRIDPEVKADVELIYSQYGMSVTDAINVFLYTSRSIGGLPFDLRPATFNAETLEAMKEGDQIIQSGKSRFESAEEMFKDLKA